MMQNIKYLYFSCFLQLATDHELMCYSRQIKFFRPNCFQDKKLLTFPFFKKKSWNQKCFDENVCTVFFHSKVTQDFPQSFISNLWPLVQSCFLIKCFYFSGSGPLRIWTLNLQRLTRMAAGKFCLQSLLTGHLRRTSISRTMLNPRTREKFRGQQIPRRSRYNILLFCTTHLTTIKCSLLTKFSTKLLSIHKCRLTRGEPAYRTVYIVSNVKQMLSQTSTKFCSPAEIFQILIEIKSVSD